ncbi:ParA family protein [Novosphingobium terrae]|uniref:ParA family protein n=1 Tax=Novosphingobium terrae TaxID=2726189 RepID=UPI00197D3D23|nr:AAA family ATPase [Novosphingobium terrae]
MGKVIAVYSMKGGVGKSSLAVNLAFEAARTGKALLWDVDAQGAASFLLGQVSGGKAMKIFSRDVDPADVVEQTAYVGLDLIAADLSLRHLDAELAEVGPKRLHKLLSRVADDYDWVVLDCPPGLGPLSEQIFRAADVLVVPVLPAPLALRTLEQVRERLTEARGKKAPPMLPVLSMVDRRKAMHREMVEEHGGWPAIPHASVVEKMGLERAPLNTFAAKSPAAKAVHAVWEQVLGAVG